MTLSIERARSRAPITWLTILGVLLLPAAVGGILVAALQNPTERLDSMTAAIVNLDEPVTINGQLTPLGRQLAAGLVEGPSNSDPELKGSNLTWVISNEEDAEAGLADGTYQAVITIPENFSEAATSAGIAIADGGGSASDDVEKATIEVATAPDGLVADDLITNQIATVAASRLGSMLSEATMQNVLVGFTSLGDQLGDAADGADQLTSGAKDAATGAAAVPDGATGLATGATGLSTGASELSTGLTTMAGTTREIAGGASELGTGLLDGATTLEESGLVPAELTQGVASLQAGIQQYADTCDPLVFGAEYCDGLKSLAAGAAGTQSGLAAFDTAATHNVATQLREAGTGASSIAAGLNQLATDGLDTSASGASELADGAAQLADGATELADGADELASGLDTLSTGLGDLASGLHTASDSLPSFTDSEATSLATVMSDPVTTNAHTDTIFGPTAIPLLAAVALWFGALASFVVIRAHTERTLTSRRSSAALALRAFAPAAAIGAGQGLLVALIVQIMADYDAGTWWTFAGMAVLAGVVFAAVNQALIALFGGAGRWVSALVGVLAVATGLISTVPGWLASIGASLPTAPAFDGLIEANGAATAALIVWGVLSQITTTLVIALRRTASPQAVLASA
ncbi:MAG: ABC transporter permease [Microbacterium sp.]